MAVSFVARAAGAALVAAAATGLSACNLDISLKAEARDQWTRHYAVTRGATLEIRNTNGVIQIEPATSDAVDIVADRVVQAATDQAAKDALAGFQIQESVAADHVALDSTSRGAGMAFNVSRRVEYHIKAPEWINVKLTTTNGDINVGPRLTGTFRAEATNGRINASGLANSASASTTNGTIAIDVVKLGEDGVSCETTNGKVTVTVPPDLNARVSARVTNGAIRTEGLKLAIAEQSRRRLDATMGSGGPTIKLETTNGAVELRAK